MDNNQRFYNPGGGTSAQVEGTDYVVDGEGFIEVDNPDHYDMLRKMGWLARGEQAPPLVTVAEPTGRVCDRWPLLTAAMTADDLDLTVARTPDDVLGLIEGRLLERARRAAAEQDISLEEFLERNLPKREEVVLNQPEPDPEPVLNLPTPEDELIPVEKPPNNYTGPVASSAPAEAPAVELEAPTDPTPVAPAVDETVEQELERTGEFSSDDNNVDQTTETEDGKTLHAASSAEEKFSLYGSSILPALIDIGADEPVQLGTVVASAHDRSGLTVDEWNALPDEERERLLENEVAKMKEPVETETETSTEAATETETETQTTQVPDPAFNKMTRAEIVDWLTANGGATHPDGTEAKGTDAKDTLIAFAEARLAELNNPAPAE